MLRDPQKSIKRLAASDTPIKRKHALKAFDKALKALQASVATEYPKLRRDGSAIVVRKSKGAFCPACRLPKTSFIALAKHIPAHLLDVKGQGWHRCFCGKEFGDAARLAKHLSGVKDLALHYGLSMLKASAGIK
jgi:hypothetical protein